MQLNLITPTVMADTSVKAQQLSHHLLLKSRSLTQHSDAVGDYHVFIGSCAAADD